MSNADGGDLFLGADGPELYDCAVLFIDLLGVTAMTQGTHKEQVENLRAVHSAVTEALDYLHDRSSFLPFAAFSDSIVVAAPLGSDDETAATALSEILYVASNLQFNMVSRGIFLRGGITIDYFHYSPNLVFGSGLVKAYHLEGKQAIHPRIVLDSKCDQLTAISSLSDIEAVMEAYVRSDHDGSCFVDYLGGKASEDPSPDLYDKLVDHGEIVRKRLEAFRGESGEWSKYRWVAEYHNDAVARLVGDESIEAASITPPGVLGRSFGPAG